MISWIYSDDVLLFIGLSPRMLVEDCPPFRFGVETRTLPELLSRLVPDEQSHLPFSRPKLVPRYLLLQRGFRTRMVLDIEQLSLIWKLSLRGRGRRSNEHTKVGARG